MMFPTPLDFLRTFKEFISEAVTFHEHNLILIIFIHVTLSFSFTSLTVALGFRWSNIDEVRGSRTDHILTQQIQQCLFWFLIFHLMNFHPFRYMHRSITSPFARRKFIIAESKCPKLLHATVPDDVSLLDTVSSANVLDAVGASEIVLDYGFQATELYPGQTLCLPMEVFPLRHLGIRYHLVFMSMVPVLVHGEVTCETRVPGCICLSYWILIEEVKSIQILL